MQVTVTEPPCRILLADSSQRFCEHLSAMLADINCDIVAVHDGFDAICRLPGIRPDLLLVASELPRLTGLQICTLLRQCPDFSALPVVLMVNDKSAVSRIQAQMLGASECLPKPFRRSELEAVLTRLVERNSVLTAVA